MRVLLTSGPCEEPIDNVRCISNFSSGRTGAELAQAFYAQGAQVRLIHGLRAQRPQDQGIQCIPFRSYADLAEALKTEIEAFQPHMILHLAAVSDYSIQSIVMDGKAHGAGSLQKIDSDQVEHFTLDIRRNPKLIDSLRGWAGPETILVGFKLTSNADLQEREEKVRKLFSHASLNYVISNDLSEISSTAHGYRIYSPTGELRSQGETKEDMQKDLIRIGSSL